MVMPPPAMLAAAPSSTQPIPIALPSIPRFPSGLQQPGAITPKIVTLGHCVSPGPTATHSFSVKLDTKPQALAANSAPAHAADGGGLEPRSNPSLCSAWCQ